MLKKWIKYNNMDNRYIYVKIRGIIVVRKFISKVLSIIMLLTLALYNVQAIDFNATNEIIFKDEVLKNIVCDKVDVNKNGKVTKDEIADLEWLYYDGSLSSNKIKDLTGLEYATNLSSLSLENNEIEDLTPISNCNKLVELSLSNNKIKDISPLSTCEGLRWLWLGNNNIEDINPLVSCINLSCIGIEGNDIKSIKPILNMSNLKDCYIDKDKFSKRERLEVLRLAETEYYLGIDKENVLEPYGILYYEEEVEVTCEDTSIINITDNHGIYFNVNPIKEGSTNVVVTLGDDHIERSISVSKINPNQSLGENKKVRYSKYSFGNHVLFDDGTLWDISQKNDMKIAKENIKKFVSGSVYEYGKNNDFKYNTFNLALDKEGSLYKMDADVPDDDVQGILIGSNIKDFDYRYMLTNDNKLLDFYGKNSGTIEDVKDWSRINEREYGLFTSRMDNSLFGYHDQKVVGTLVLKFDGTLLMRRDSNEYENINSFSKIRDDVDKLTENNSFITKSGEYYKVLYNSEEDKLEVKYITSNVKNVIANKFIVKKDGTTWSDDGCKLLDSEVVDYEEPIILDSDKNLWRYEGTGELTNIDNNVSEILNCSDYKKTDGKVYSEGTALNYITSFYDYQLGLDGVLTYRGIPILNGVQDLICGSAFYNIVAIRGYGTLWDVTDIKPEKLDGINADLNSDGWTNMLDLAMLSNCYNAKTNDNNYKVKYDLNKDGIIDIYDIVKLSKRI